MISSPKRARVTKGATVPRWPRTAAGWRPRPVRFARGILKAIPFWSKRVSGTKPEPTMPRKPRPLNANPRRQATPPIRGYSYQIWQTLLHWIRLSRDEVLYIEAAEDLDVITTTKAEAIQVGHLARSVTLRTPKVLEAIRNAWLHQESNAGRDVHLRFLTSARRGIERPPVVSGRGLDYWEACQRNPGLDSKPLREFLARQSALPVNLRRFVADASEEQFRERLLCRVHWSTAQGSLGGIRKEVSDRLVTFADEHSVVPSAAQRAVSHLHDAVWQAACGKGDRRLTRADFLCAFENAVTVRVLCAWGPSIPSVTSPLSAEITTTRNPYGRSRYERSRGDATAFYPEAPTTTVSIGQQSGRFVRQHREVGKRTGVKLLTYSQRRVAGLIATAPFPFTDAELREIFPDLVAQREIEWLRRRRLIRRKVAGSSLRRLCGKPFGQIRVKLAIWTVCGCRGSRPSSITLTSQPSWG